MRRSLEQRVVEAMVRGGLTLSVAESCTGGLLGHRVTNVSGSSACFRGGIIAYANDVKIRLLDVAAAVLEDHGAVSGPVAVAMASGVRSHLGADIGLGITGIAGPSGGTAAKPVGLVYVALAARGAERVRECHFDGDREAIKTSAADAAIELLNDYLAAGGREPEGDRDGEETC